MSSPSPLRALADFLCDRRGIITQHWIEALRGDGRVPTANHQPTSELVDHLPKLFDNLTDQLRDCEEPEPKTAAAENARAHGRHRWGQNFHLGELLREIGVLRRVFLEQCLPFRRERPDFTIDSDIRASTTIHSFFDSLAVDSATQFIDEHQQHLQESTRALQSAVEKEQQANARLQETDGQRLRMLRTISHELRNVLGGMQTAMQALAEEESELVRQKLIVILFRNLDQMTNLASQLLDFASLLSGGELLHVEEFDPSLLFDELVLAGQPLAVAKNLQFAGTLDPLIGSVRSDEQKIQRIATNLITNAIKYCHEGCVLLEFVSVSDEEWAITVTDTGEGIPVDQQEQIFREFHRLPGAMKSPGAGLGLAITKQLVDLLCGRIEVHSEVGRGSRFRVILPKTQPAPAAAN